MLQKSVTSITYRDKCRMIISVNIFSQTNINFTKTFVTWRLVTTLNSRSFMYKDYKMNLRGSIRHLEFSSESGRQCIEAQGATWGNFRSSECHNWETVLHNACVHKTFLVLHKITFCRFGRAFSLTLYSRQSFLVSFKIKQFSRIFGL